jgi:hypothetical protein
LLTCAAQILMCAAILERYEIVEKQGGHHQSGSAVQESNRTRTKIKELKPPLLIRISDSLKRKRQLGIDTEMAV